MQRRRPVDLRSVHVGLLAQQRADRSLVALHHRIGDVAARRADHKSRSGHQQGRDTSDDST
jgi:hypothetical protein